MSYYYKKSILYEFDTNDTFVKIDIKKNIITCNNALIKKDIETKIKNINIIILTFYVSKYDYNLLKEDYYWNTIKTLSIDELPIYRINNDFEEFTTWYNNYFNNNNIRIYETQQFTKREHIFDDVEKCKKSVSYDEKTNHKFDKFVQLFYHAGDWADVERYGLLYVRILFDSLQVTKNTMKYMFDIMKKGVLVGIKSNKLAIFLPFSKFNYENDFYDELYFDDEDHKLLIEYKKTGNKNLLKKLTNNVYQFLNKYHLDKNIMYDRQKWVANDCFFRNEAYEGDKLEALYEDMFYKLCENREIPDCIFFLNLRDHPMLKKDLTNAYPSITDKPIDVKYKFDNYSTIFSVCGSKHYQDVPMLTPDDWYRARKKYYPDDCKNIYIETNNDIELNWDNKKPIAIFRGSATGCGVNENDNMRIKATILSKKYPQLLDAGLTSFNRKPKKMLNKPLRIIDNHKLGINKANFINTSEKSRYKYILTIDGHVSAFRLSYEFSFKSLILLQESEFYMWFSDKIKPYEHFIPIKKDLSNLIEQIEWCKTHDDECKKIVQNGYDFYINNLQIKNMYDYMQNVLTNIHQIKDKTINNNKIENTINIKNNINIAIITIYRNDINNERLKQKRLFTYYMTKLFKNYGNYTIIVVEQNNIDKFNIGILKNIGFDYLTNTIKKKFDNYIFTDIDMIPNSDLIEYYFKITDGLNSLASKGTRYSSKTNENKIFFGACISMSGEIFKKINGYPNNYIFGWGGEDEQLGMNAINEKINIYSNKYGELIDIEEMNGKTITISDKLQELKKNDNYSSNKFELLLLHDLYKKNGLSNLKYKVLNEFNNDNIYHIIIDPLTDEYKKNNPELFNFSKYNNIAEKYNILKQQINNIKPISF